jgi:hypothetical protein
LSNAPYGNGNREETLLTLCKKVSRTVPLYPASKATPPATSTAAIHRR